MAKKLSIPFLPKQGTKFSIFISTGVILGVIFIYLVVSSINSYSFDSIIDINAKTMLRQSLAATDQELHDFITTSNSSVRSIQSIIAAQANGFNSSSLQELLLAQLLTNPHATGVMYATTSGDFTYFRRHTDNKESKHSIIIDNGFALKKIRHQGNKKVSLEYYTQKPLQRIESRAEHDIRGDTYDPLSRIWYKNAIRRMDVSWSKPYKFFSSQKPGITVSAPVVKNKTVIGVVGIDFELDSLSDFIGELTKDTFYHEDSQKSAKAIPEAVIFINDTAGTESTVIATTAKMSGEPAKDRLGKLSQLNVKALRYGAEKFKHSEQDRLYGVFQDAGAGSYYYMFHNCGEPDCDLDIATGFVIPYSLISGDISTFAHNIQYVFLAAVVLCLIIALYVAKGFSKPINHLSELTADISRLDFTKAPDIALTPYYEINTAITTFDNMWRSLKNYKEYNLELSEQLKSSYRETILRLASAAEYKDQDTREHLTRMSEYSGMLATQLGLPPEEVERIRFAAPMHDIGKIGIPDAILLKPGKLTSEEFEQMKKHSAYGYDLLQPPESEIMRLSAIIALNHHEKFDGSGYPNGKQGADIPQVAQIVAIADVYDALRSKRCYKEAMSHSDVIDIICKESGQHFDPVLVDAFMAIHTEIYDISCKYDTSIPLEQPCQT